MATELKQFAREHQRAHPQVLRRRGRAAQHRQHVMRLQRRPDPAPHWLRTVRAQDAQLQSMRCGYLFQQRLQTIGVLVAAHLGGRPDRDVDQGMGRAGGDFLRQHGCDELGIAVEVERPLDPDQQVVGRTQAQGAAPDEAAADVFDDPAHRRHVEIDGS